MICSCEVLQFYSAAENYALGFSEDLETVKRLYLSSINKDEKEAECFVNSLPKIRKELSEDLQFFLDSDPAADSKEEIVLAYPGFKAIRYYRIAHQ